MPAAARHNGGSFLMAKSQATIEIIFAIATIIIIFILLGAFTYNRKIDVQNFDKTTSAKKVCFKLSNLIIGAFINGEGTTLSDKITKNVTSQANSLYIEDNFCGLPAHVLAHNLTIAKGKITVENKNNSIMIEHG